ncbi:MAG: 30S ribosomal protein S6 [Planctomycetota bacterium]|nr:30S ribosomal protein S6 [Planctomycetota bacterium]
MKTYEALFLLDPALSSDFSTAEAEVKRLLERAEAEMLGLSKWDERKLAYPIRNHKRGLYILCYFKVGSTKIADLERDVRLSESVVRALILAKEGMTAEQIEKSLASTPATEKPAPRPDEGGRGRDRDRPAASVDSKPKPAASDDSKPKPAGSDDSKPKPAASDDSKPKPADSDDSAPGTATQPQDTASATAVAEPTEADKTESGS